MRERRQPRFVLIDQKGRTNGCEYRRSCLGNCKDPIPNFSCIWPKLMPKLLLISTKIN